MGFYQPSFFNINYRGLQCWFFSSSQETYNKLCICSSLYPAINFHLCLAELSVDIAEWGVKMMLTCNLSKYPLQSQSAEWQVNNVHMQPK